MISYIKGPLTAIEEDVIVVEAGGVGMGIHVPLSVLDRLPGIGREVTVYTYFQVREDAMSLYGFLNRQDRDMFRQLIGGNGVGASPALGTIGMGEAAKEAGQALVALGYSNMEANKAVKQVEVTETMTAEDVLKASLRYLSF